MVTRRLGDDEKIIAFEDAAQAKNWINNGCKAGELGVVFSGDSRSVSGD